MRDELKIKRNFKALEEIVNSANDNIDVKNLTDNELVYLINNTTDLGLLDLAETEFVNRNTKDIPENVFDDSDFAEEIFKEWRNDETIS